MTKIYIEINYARNKKTEGCISDINRKGLSFVSPVRMRKNTFINIIPKADDLVNLKGRIAYTSKIERKNYKYKSGVEFVSLDGRQKISLDKFISKLDRRKSIRLSFV